MNYLNYKSDDLAKLPLTELEVIRRNLILDNSECIEKIFRIVEFAGLETAYSGYYTKQIEHNGWIFRVVQLESSYDASKKDFRIVYGVYVKTTQDNKYNPKTTWMNVRYGNYDTLEELIQAHNYLRPGEWLSIVDQLVAELASKAIQKAEQIDEIRRKVIISLLTG